MGFVYTFMETVSVSPIVVGISYRCDFGNSKNRFDWTGERAPTRGRARARRSARARGGERRRRWRQGGRRERTDTHTHTRKKEKKIGFSKPMRRNQNSVEQIRGV